MHKFDEVTKEKKIISKNGFEDSGVLEHLCMLISGTSIYSLSRQRNAIESLCNSVSKQQRK